MKNTLIILFVIALIGIGAYVFTKKPSETVNNISVNEPATKIENEEVINEVTKKEEQKVDTTKTVIGSSISGNPITAYHYGEGTKELLFVGGIHGGYEWNTVLLAYQLMDHLKANPAVIPKNIKVTVIPVMNPDGLKKVVGTTERFLQKDVSLSENTIISGRFNANNVDLSRNFDCDWKAKGVWQEKTVSGGAGAFSEPESKAIKNYVEGHTPAAVVVWYSAAGGVFASSCDNGVSTETSAITKKFANASGYPAYESFDHYATTGDMVNWFAKNNIPAISVLLTNHTDTEWTKNKMGFEALLKYYTK